MANDYFNHVANRVQAGTRAIAANVNDVADEISTGLDKLPTEDEFKLGLTRYAVDTGAADAYILTMPYTPVLTDGFNLTFKAVNANTGASTLNVNSTGAKSIVNPDGSALIANTFSANAIIIVAYEVIGDRYILVSQNPAQAALAQSSAIAAAASAAAALVSEGNAATSESNAASSAGAASTSASNASTSETNAGTSETNAAASFLSFDKSYLGAKASDPTLDNQSQALQDGALYFNTTSNQMKVYDLGTTTWLFFQDGGDAASLDGLDSTQFVRTDAASSITTGATTGNAISITETALTSGAALNISLDSAGMNSAAIYFHQENASATGDLLYIEDLVSAGGMLSMYSEGTGTMILASASTGSAMTQPIAVIENTTLAANTNDALQVASSTAGIALNVLHTGAGPVARFYGNSASRTVDMVHVIQDHASATGDAMSIQNDGTGKGLDILQNGNQIGFQVTTFATTQWGAYFSANVASRTVPLVEIVNDNPTGTGVAFKIQQDQGGDAADIVQDNTLGSGLRVYTNAVARNADLVTIIDDNTGGVSGKAGLYVKQDSNNGTGIKIDADGTSASAMILSVPNTANDGVRVSHGGAGTAFKGFITGTGRGVDMDVSSTTAYAFYANTNTASRTNPLAYLNMNGSGASDTLQLLNASTSGKALRAYSTANGRTVPLVEMISDTANAADVSTLYIQTDGQFNSPSIELAGGYGGIKFNFTNDNTDSNTLDAYVEGTFEVTMTAQTSGTITMVGSDNTLGYVRIGRLVNVYGKIQINSVSSPVGIIKVTGLPYAGVTTDPENSDLYRFTFIAHELSSAPLAILNGQLNGTNIDLREGDGVSTLNNLDTKLQSGTQLFFNFHYITDANP